MPRSSPTPNLDRWLAASARLRDAEQAFCQHQLASLHEGRPPPTPEEVDALIRQRAESAQLLSQAMEEVRLLAASVSAPAVSHPRPSATPHPTP